MKKIILALSVMMLAAHLPAPVTGIPGATLTITTLDSVHLQIVATGVPPFSQAIFETSTNLVDWTIISTNTAGISQIVTNIVEATNSMAFYRDFLK